MVMLPLACRKSRQSNYVNTRLSRSRDRGSRASLRPRSLSSPQIAELYSTKRTRSVQLYGCTYHVQYVSVH